MGCNASAGPSPKHERSFNDGIETMRSRSEELTQLTAEPVKAQSDRSGLSASGSTPSQRGKDLRLLVFDFDCTIARIHVWSKYQNAPLDKIPITDMTFVDVRAFREFVQATTGYGHKVAIATFGRRDVVNKAITYALGGNHGIVISTPADHQCQEGSASLRNKNTQLNSLAERFDVRLSQIIFLDDDNNNVREANRIGVRSIHTPHGISKEVLGDVLRELLE